MRDIINTDWTRQYTQGDAKTRKAAYDHEVRYTGRPLVEYAQAVEWREQDDANPPTFVRAPMPRTEYVDKQLYRAVFRLESPTPAKEDILAGSWLSTNASTLEGTQVTVVAVTAALYVHGQGVRVEVLYTAEHDLGGPLNVRHTRRTDPVTVTAFPITTYEETSYELENTAQRVQEDGGHQDPPSPGLEPSDAFGALNLTERTDRPAGTEAAELGRRPSGGGGEHDASPSSRVRTTLRRR